MFGTYPESGIDVGLGTRVRRGIAATAKLKTGFRVRSQRSQTFELTN
jgi:hypothetical protein